MSKRIVRRLRLRERLVSFKGIPNHSNYLFGDDGSVWTRVKGLWRELRGWRERDGRIRVSLRNDDGEHRKWLVHVAILTAHVGPKPTLKHECRHFPYDDPTDNRLANLQWGTSKENKADRKIHRTDNSGERCGTAKLKAWQAYVSLKLVSIYGWPTNLLADLFGVSSGIVLGIVKGRGWVQALLEYKESTTREQRRRLVLKMHQLMLIRNAGGSGICITG
jgi:hypothetical protein